MCVCVCVCVFIDKYTHKKNQEGKRGGMEERENRHDHTTIMAHKHEKTTTKTTPEEVLGTQESQQEKPRMSQSQSQLRMRELDRMPRPGGRQAWSHGSRTGQRKEKDKGRPPTRNVSQSW